MKEFYAPPLDQYREMCEQKVVLKLQHRGVAKLMARDMVAAKRIAAREAAGKVQGFVMADAWVLRPYPQPGLPRGARRPRC